MGGITRRQGKGKGKGEIVSEVIGKGKGEIESVSHEF